MLRKQQISISTLKPLAEKIDFDTELILERPAEGSLILNVFTRKKVDTGTYVTSEICRIYLGDLETALRKMRAQ